MACGAAPGAADAALADCIDSNSAEPGGTIRRTAVRRPRQRSGHFRGGRTHPVTSWYLSYFVSLNASSHTVIVPGSVANLGGGFDTLGVAVELYLRARIVDVAMLVQGR